MSKCILLLMWLTLSVSTLSAQNITDLAVMNDKTVSTSVQTDDETNTIDESVFLVPDRVKYDSRCFQIEGRDEFIFSGTMHYFRVPRELWADRLDKVRAAGFNCVETYIPWNWHEREMPRSTGDYSHIDLSDFETFLTMAEQRGLYVIARPGPYICAEWSGGGFPQWLMRKRPAKTKHEVWLQSTDPTFMAWNEHWYKAVCRVAANHQISRRAPGTGGIILFQIENEFDRVNWFSWDEKRQYLESLATLVRANGIEVPIITCWTSQSRNVKEGPLSGVLDMVNSYPRWNVEGSFGRLVSIQQKTQPGKPLLSGELQGGWISEQNTPLSWNQDGLIPAQTQNLTLYALERGFCGMNYYMLVGGSHFDQWGARNMTQTYDYGAAIGEDGTLNDRYRRFTALSALAREHGTRIARARLVDINYKSSDPDVRVALRQTADGDRYYFLRTEEHSRSHHGTVIIGDSLAIDFALEPFGSMIYYMPGQHYGQTASPQWLPQMPQPTSRTVVAADTLRPEIKITDQGVPTKWRKLKRGQRIDDLGIYNRHPMIYRFTAQPSMRHIEIGRVGDRVVNGTRADGVFVSVGGRYLQPTEETAEYAAFDLPQTDSKKGQEVLILHDDRGLHHHTNLSVEQHWQTGLDFVRVNGREQQLEFADGETLWAEMEFQAPTEGRLFHLNLQATGNAFIYLNGHPLGRHWQRGPQSSYWLPDCWLNSDNTNTIRISLLPDDDLQAATIDTTQTFITISSK